MAFGIAGRESRIRRQTKSSFGGAMLIAGTAVGAGMFSMPSISSGMWFSWSILCLIVTWFCMYHTSLLIAEVNLHYPEGSSFDTFIRDLLGKYWNLLNGIALTFVLYVLTYAYISGSGSLISQYAQSRFQFAISSSHAGVLFTLSMAIFVALCANRVGNLATILIVGMGVSLLSLVFDLTLGADLSLLFSTEDNESYYPYIFSAIPFFVAAFGFHGTVPSLIKIYEKDHIKIRNSLLFGSLIAMATYALWLFATMANISRPEFQVIVGKGGNIASLVTALGEYNKTILHWFTLMAVTSSFLGVTLGLFDYISDFFDFNWSRSGRLKTAAITFIPPAIACLIFPNGFLHAIGLAGLAGTLWAIIIPALAAKECRKKFNNGEFRVRGGSILIHFLIFFGVALALFEILALLGKLPVL
ncbi:tryptophan permease [Pseudomaricurvus alkylphenolicus]|uniref:aromatic amino acid transport family protein n=1 Tax=Pseudomaricurvus alkylphenolicus TaxID=1306991 RepID=UPI00142473E1|nr:aromatic amino acid transport family protein [Pseudomaricurvus alkylphenolicus]NIB38442.1 tryptophan permease [Pseudomaricurvus alkylphenolicus]